MLSLLDESHFRAAICRNCGAPLDTPYCAACGQKKAARFGIRDVGEEAWQKIRWFEGNLVLAGMRVLLQPGAVARDYVLGARAAHVHPFKLLLAAILLLLLVIHQTGYLGATSAAMTRAVELVQS